MKYSAYCLLFLFPILLPAQRQDSMRLEAYFTEAEQCSKKLKAIIHLQR